MLLYLTDCSQGGETLLLKECTKEIPIPRENFPDVDWADHDGDASTALLWPETVVFATQPKRGRILLFPHAVPHAGASVVTVPKICLRAEVALLPV